MIRFMGFVTGAAVAIGAMLLVFGFPQAPEATPADQATGNAPPANTAHGSESETPGSRAVEPPKIDSTIAEPETVATNPQPPAAQWDATPEPEERVNPEPAPQPARETPPVDELVDDEPPVAPIAVADEAPSRELRWHAFWSPFASQIAANGFVSRLEAVTGFDYRVVKIDNGVYEVAFGYEDDDEMLTKLAAIEAATGLEMPDS